MTVYKLTAQDMTTRDGFRYELGVTARATGDSTQGLCSDGYLHWYLSPHAAVFLNPIHANIVNPRLWRAEADDMSAMYDHTLKGGSHTLTLVEEMVLPVWTIEQRVQAAIAMAWPTASVSWRTWAAAWLKGDNRSEAEAASASAAWASASAAWAASAAAGAAEAAWAASAAAAAEAAAWASASAAWASAAAGAAAVDIPAIFTQVLTETCAQTADRLEGGR